MATIAAWPSHSCHPPHHVPPPSSPLLRPTPHTQWYPGKWVINGIAGAFWPFNRFWGYGWQYNRPWNAYFNPLRPFGAYGAFRPNWWVACGLEASMRPYSQRPAPSVCPLLMRYMCSD